ncbi:beta-microseminoprotein-like [Corythoichthys intestinalis]|uniref:beta-microseminoprotein-like n=1 Tax=Corythoichthys intestinalis TaxID=161448 RepID=UPI0025A50D71|nr:beta-microseminoprotein-like [Corythoichthys intestinalis]
MFTIISKVLPVSFTAIPYETRRQTLLRSSAKMRRYLSLAFVVCAMLPSSYGFCTAKVQDQGKTHCFDEVDNKWHPVGSTWINSESMDCSCSRCCTVYAIPRNFPDDCVSVFDNVACVYKVHKRDDPSVECPFLGAVGK